MDKHEGQKLLGDKPHTCASVPKQMLRQALFREPQRENPLLLPLGGGSKEPFPKMPVFGSSC